MVKKDKPTVKKKKSDVSKEPDRLDNDSLKDVTGGGNGGAGGNGGNGGGLIGKKLGTDWIK